MKSDLMFTSQARFNIAFSSALIGGNITPYFQPIVSLEENRTVGFEVLARWHDEKQGNIPPSVFVFHAEKADMLDELLDSLMRQSFAAAQDWDGDFYLAFNLSPTQLQHPHLPERIASLAKEFGFPLERLHIEITETAILEDEKNSRRVLEQIIAMGCAISLDDFGTGYSSLTWLRTLPFSKIKIDTSFVRSMLEQKESRKIVAAVVGLGQSLDLSVIAEGVETLEQAELLQKIGCGYAQGYLFSRPVPANAVPGLLRGPASAAFATDPANLTLEQRAHQISALYASDNMSICFLGLDYVIKDASPVFARNLGRPLDDVIGRHVNDVMPEGVGRIAWLHSYWARNLPAPAYERKLPDGGTHLLFIHRVPDEVGELLGYSIIVIDITENKKTEEALRKSEEHYRIAATLSPRLSWQMDAQGQIEAIDESYARMMGLVLDDVRGTKWTNIVHPADRDRIKASWGRALSNGSVYDEELRYRMPDGSYRWFRSYVAPQKAPDGTVLRWYGQKEDIDTRKISLDALRDQEEQFRFILDNCPHLFWMTTPDGQMTRANPRIFHLTGQTYEQTRNHGWLDIVHPEQRAAVRAQWMECLRTGKVYDVDFQARLSDGRWHWMRAWGAPRCDDARNILGWYGTLSEITTPRSPGAQLPAVSPLRAYTLHDEQESQSREIAALPRTWSR
ncbi:EAL domain-containing protein [Roseomonas mucosa]|nr:EAL domain-containing protein [Roseomonas mucosa]MDT8274730.1 EAL domain-containing protein [Roseomonas mucosa]